MSKKTWKDHLLSSGVPLEYSVARIFEQLGIFRPEEFCYERKNAEGLPQVFSVDIHSSDIDTQRNLWVESLVECKYRHDGTRWVFSPREYAELWGPDFQDLFVTLDQCCLDRKLNREILSKFGDHYPLCGKGIELLPEDSNPKTIEQAVHQLRYAVVAKTIDAIKHQVGQLLGPVTPIFVIVPIIVTTAELWRLRTGTTVEDVRNAEELGDVADFHDIVVLSQRPDNLDSKHTLAAFEEQLSAKQRETLNILIGRSMDRSLAFFADYFAAYTPSLFIIISYKRVQSAMTNLHNFFTQDHIVLPRQKKNNSTS